MWKETRILWMCYEKTEAEKSDNHWKTEEEEKETFLKEQTR